VHVRFCTRPYRIEHIDAIDRQVIDPFSIEPIVVLFVTKATSGTYSTVLRFEPYAGISTGLITLSHRLNPVNIPKLKEADALQMEHKEPARNKPARR
jgi:hypothetical protein